MAIDNKYGVVTTEHGQIGATEPVVVFRAKDVLLPKLLKIYSILCGLIGSPQKHLDAIHDAAMKVKEWQALNPDLVDTPRSRHYTPPVRIPAEEQDGHQFTSR